MPSSAPTTAPSSNGRASEWTLGREPRSQWMKVGMSTAAPMSTREESRSRRPAPELSCPARPSSGGPPLPVRRRWLRPLGDHARSAGSSTPSSGASAGAAEPNSTRRLRPRCGFRGGGGFFTAPLPRTVPLPLPGIVLLPLPGILLLRLPGVHRHGRRRPAAPGRLEPTRRPGAPSSNLLAPRRVRLQGGVPPAARPGHRAGGWCRSSSPSSSSPR